MKKFYFASALLSLLLPQFARADQLLETQRKFHLESYEASLKDTQAVIECIKAAKEVSVMNSCPKILSSKAAERAKASKPGAPAAPADGTKKKDK